MVDATSEGPVVQKVDPRSPLQGLLFPGDIMVAMGDVDTREMSTSAITALMVLASGVRRRLTLLSEVCYVDEQSGKIQEGHAERSNGVVVPREEEAPAETLIAPEQGSDTEGEASETPSIPLVPFSLWINTTANQHQQEGKKPETTLLDQIKYAKDLYDVSQRQRGEGDINEETILSNLQSSPLDRPLVSPLMGISVDWLLDVFRKLPFVTKLSDFGCQLWFVRKVCIIELLRRVGVSSGPFVESAERVCRGNDAE